MSECQFVHTKFQMNRSGNEAGVFFNDRQETNHLKYSYVMDSRF